MKKVQNKDFPQLAAELKNLRSINDIHKELIDRGLRYLEKTYKTQI
jgi:hypothetical protein